MSSKQTTASFLTNQVGLQSVNSDKVSTGSNHHFVSNYCFRGYIPRPRAARSVAKSTAAFFRTKQV